MNYDGVRPSTSAGGMTAQPSNSSLTSAISTSTTISSASSSSSKNSFHIELIKCEDIKVWTDQTRELGNQQQSAQILTAEINIIPQKKRHRRKSTSPLNSFLATLFNTPKHRNRYCSMQQLDDSLNTQHANVSHSSSVFDAFLPVYGKKLRSRQTENFFEDGANTLDYTTTTSSTDCCPAIDAIDQPTPTKNQSLKVFLQKAHLSRNNTELEKENLHFQISEAVISVIEQIKWAKIEPDKQNYCTDVTSLSDCLESKEQPKTEASSLPAIYSCLSASDDSGTSAPSAEDVGLSLIAKFKQQQLPQVSALQWLVEEKDAPQKMLPMPIDRTLVNFDNKVLPSRTRGTKNWAPPRPQIIFTDHDPPNRKELLKSQNMRCAGCGMRLALQVRYCHYLGKYHCTICHRNQLAATPAKILQTWNFKCYPVSTFSYRLLEQMYAFPLFYVPDLNPDLYVRSKALMEARNKRSQLKFVMDFIKTCRYAERVQHFVDMIPKYLTEDLDMWSLADFHEAQSKNMHNFIAELIAKCEEHIFSCLLCTGRGFICAFCLQDEILFPWESETLRCDLCGSCFHFKCWQRVCCRCKRIKERRLNEKEKMKDESSKEDLNDY